MSELPNVLLGATCFMAGFGTRVLIEYLRRRWAARGN